MAKQKTKTSRRSKVRRFFDNLMVVGALLMMGTGFFTLGYGARVMQEEKANSLPVQLCPYVFSETEEAGGNLSVTYMEDASDLYRC